MLKVVLPESTQAKASQMCSRQLMCLTLAVCVWGGILRKHKTHPRPEGNKESGEGEKTECLGAARTELGK